MGQNMLACLFVFVVVVLLLIIIKNTSDIRCLPMSVHPSSVLWSYHKN